MVVASAGGVVVVMVDVVGGQKCGSHDGGDDVDEGGVGGKSVAWDGVQWWKGDGGDGSAIGYRGQALSVNMKL
uniref:Uncharacterized protein n=1 Tax=Tanacetum cinerariifolium TaxID=118510 RepID=A0A6L2N092_TANCI|nr:hypothetical protein [Tanacetum cinerariifolium]